VSGSVIEKHAVLAVGQAGAEIVARRQEQVPQALGLGPLAQLDQNPRQRGVAVDFAIERLLDLALVEVHVLAHELLQALE
jgi:hypothetical protein